MAPQPEKNTRRALSQSSRRGAALRLAALGLTLLPACLVSIPELREKPGDVGAGGEAASSATAGAAGDGGGDGPTPVVARCSTPYVAPAVTRQWPADVGVVDVTLAPYLAAGDGVTDDTAALQQAISDHVGTGRIVLLPAGTYLISDTLDAVDALGEPRRAITLQGAGRDLTVLRLAATALGFDSPAAPKPVVRLNGEDAGQASRNHVLDLSIDVGERRCAVALDFVGHNTSSVENVTLRAAQGAGAIGLKLERPWAGSRLIRNVLVEHFDVGVSVAQEKFGNTFEHLELRGQRRAGLLNDRSFTVIRDLKSDNSVPAIQSTHALGMLVLVEAELLGGMPEQPAIASEGELFTRDVVVQGYGPSIELRGLAVAQGDIAEFSSRGPAHLTGTGQGSLGLRIEETPDPAAPPLGDWLSVTELGAIAGDALDDSAAVQAALDSGARAVYFPFGEYLIGSTLTVPESVELVFGAESTLRIAAGATFAAASAGGAPNPVFRVAGQSTPLRFERLVFATDAAEELAAVLFEQAAPRDLTLTLIEGTHVDSWPLLYRAAPQAGRVFFQCVHGGGIQLAPAQKAWLRAGNFEANQPMIDNDGAELWALGLKSYTPHTLIATRDAGHSELLGAFLLPEPEEAEPSPAFTIDDASASLVFATFTDAAEGEYPVHVRETYDGATRELLPDAERVLGVGSYVPLFVGHSYDARRCGP